MQLSDLQTLERLGLAALLGSVVGFERERLQWAAGIRTHMLVCMGSCLMMLVSAFGFSEALQQAHVVLDPSRVAAQVVSGIGFLGAGAILLRGQVVRGLTTAASIWAVAGIGLAVGGGLYFAAAASTGIIVLILAGVKPIEEAYRSRKLSSDITVIAERGSLSFDALKKLARVRSGQIRRYVIEPIEAEDLERLKLSLVHVTPSDVEQIVQRLERLPGAREVLAVRKRSDPTKS